MSTTTAVLLFILVGYSLQQDSVDYNTCSSDIQLINSNCLSLSGFSFLDSEDLDNGLCTNGLALTQCVDASCMTTSVQETVQIVVRALNRPNVCPMCYSRPAIVSNQTKQTCTVWGQHHVVPFARQPETCSLDLYTIFSNPFFSLLAESNATSIPGVMGISAVRFDYKACAVFSRTWRKSSGWKAETIRTQGWFPHTIQITQNTTHVFIVLPALNTEITIAASANSMAVSVSTAIYSPAATGVCMSNYCVRDSVIYSGNPPLAPCTAYPPEFRQACWADLLLAVPVTTSVPDAVAIDADLASRANASSLPVVEFQKTGLPIVLTLIPTGMMVGVFIGGFFWRRKEIKRAVETMNFAIAYNGCCNKGTCCCCCFSGGVDEARHAHKNLESAPIRAFWCWIVFCLNPHVLGMVFPFTGLTLLSAFCGIWILAWVGSNHKCIHFGSSKFTLQSIHVTKAFLAFALPQQVAIGIIGAAAMEYYLIEVQFWWGLAVLVLMLIGGTFMCFLCLDMSWAAKILNGSEPSRQEQPMQTLNTLMAALEANRVEQQPPQQHVVQVQVQQLPQPTRVELVPQAQPIMMQQQGPVVPPPQAHVIMQPQQQEHVIQPRPQSHVIEAQPIFYGNPSEAPPPPMSGGAFNAPSPIDVYQNPVKYMATSDSNQFVGLSGNSDTARQVAKRAIKIAGIEVDPVREGLICGKMQELLQSHNILGSLYGDDSRAAGLRNDLAKSLAEELKMYRNDSIEDLGYGLKEAVLLWKDEHQL